MAAKRRTFTEAAYERLKAHKREGESSSRTILRLTGADRYPVQGFGVTSPVDGVRKAMQSTRDAVDGTQA